MKKLLLPVLLVFFVSTSQLTLAQTKPQPAVLNHLAIFVADLKTATDFYSDLFNLPQIANPFNDGKHTWFSLGGTAQFHIIKGATQRGNYLVDEHLCFSVPSINDFVKKLNDRNITFGNFAKTPKAITLRPDGVHQIYFQDPDGHWIEVNDAK